MALTRVLVDMVYDKPLTAHNSFVVINGILPAGLDKIYFDKNKIVGIHGVLVFLSGVRQANFELDASGKIILPGALSEDVSYTIVLFGEPSVSIIRFITSKADSDVNFFLESNYKPDASDFVVLINGEKTDYNYDSISFDEGDEVIIKAKSLDIKYPKFSASYHEIRTDPIVGNYTIHNGYDNIISILDPLPLMYDTVDGFLQEITDFNRCFYDNKSLVSIPDNLFVNNKGITDFGFVFYGCTSLTSAPEHLFVANSKASIFTDCFAFSGLESVPENLFFYNKEITRLDHAFIGCTLSDFVLRLSAKNIQNISNVHPIGVNTTVIIPFPSATYDTCTRYNNVLIETYPA